ncbi:hypothetical protein [Roseomonas sp. BN140053]|uniref:hypothetical protein n=1 Tax=Roseomonas sp. BN140053 TaxID=3391898 RepID=UPI0039E9BEE6
MARNTAAIAALALALGVSTGAMAQLQPGQGPAFGGNNNSATDSMRPLPGSAPPVSRNTPGATPPSTSRSVTDSMRPQPGSAPATTRPGIGATPYSTSNSVTDSGSLNLEARPRGRRNTVSAPAPAVDAADRPARRAAAAAAPRRGRAASGSDAAYMGGGMVMERAPDGTMRPVN